MFIRSSGPITLSPMPPHAPEILRLGVAKLKMMYWLTTGTLLGLYRDNCIIPHDTDLDIAVVGYDNIWVDIITRLSEFEILRVVLNHNRIQQLAFKHSGVIFDIFIYWKDSNSLTYINDGDGGKLVIAPNLIEKTCLFDTQYGTFQIPCRPETYLESLYGRDWRIPSNDKPRYIR